MICAAKAELAAGTASSPSPRGPPSGPMSPGSGADVARAAAASVEARIRSREKELLPLYLQVRLGWS